MTMDKTATKLGGLKTTLSTLALALVLGVSMAGAAHADPGYHDDHYDHGDYHDHDDHHDRDDHHAYRYDRHHDREWNEHEREAYEWRLHHQVLAPGYVYAPPVVYAAPPPPLGLNLIIPLNIR